jgi:uncharacterized membrane protein
MNKMLRIIQVIVPVLLLGCLLLTIVPVQADTVVPAQPPNGKTNLVLNLLPGSYYDRIQAGEETHLYLELRNQGDTAITGIHFNAGLPKGWSVRFVPADLAVLTAGSSTTIEAFLTTDKNAGGGYNVTLLADSDQTRGATTAYFNVKGGSTLWLWLGIGLGVIVIMGFVLVFFRQGKH